MDHSLWVFIHVMLLVYWLGGDLGVFILARAAKRAELSFAERAFALRMAIVIDLVPRLCFTVMFPIGLHVADSGGFVEVSDAAFVIAWAVTFVWIALLLAIGRNEGSPLGHTLNQVHLALQFALLIVIGSLGVAAVTGQGPFPPGWFGWKILLFALIFAMSIGIDFAFRPIGPAFARLAVEGSKPEIEATITRAVDGAILFVLGLYALLVAITFLGITKFL